MQSACDLFRPPQGNAIRPVTLWTDVTTLLDWQGPFTGIPRTLSSLLGVWLADEALPLRACCYDARRRCFVEVSRAQLHGVLSTGQEGKRLGRAPQESPPRWRLDIRAGRAVRPFFRALPHELQVPCRVGYGAVKHAARFLHQAATLAGTPLRWAWQGIPQRPQPAPFAPGDVLLAAGGGWDHRGFCTALAGVRAACGVRVVPILYDLIPCLMPQLFPPQLPPLFRAWAAGLLRLSDLVLTISEHSRRDLLEWAGRLAPQMSIPVEVVRLGVEVGGAGQPVRPAGLPEDGCGPFVLSVGTLEVRKNHSVLYHAWRRLIQQHGDAVLPLVLAGATGWLTDDLQEQLRRDPLVCGRIIHLSSVTNDELEWLYRHCRFSLYPSLYEGWGLPVAECLARGKYCISSDAASLPEIAGDLIDYHDPLDLPACVRLVRRALFEEGFVEAREERIRREHRASSWQDCAAQVLSLLAGAGPARPARASLPSSCPNNPKPIFSWSAHVCL